MTAAQEMGPNSMDDATPVELIARVVPSGNQFLATVDGLELQINGRTPEAAENGLVQAMRGWLERQDTVGRLGQALGLDSLDENTEIVLRFVSNDQGVEDAAGG
jgi:hypothetical protein